MVQANFKWKRSLEFQMKQPQLKSHRIRKKIIVHHWNNPFETHQSIAAEVTLFETHPCIAAERISVETHCRIAERPQGPEIASSAR